MNPFTKFLNQWSGNRPFDEFIAHWDVLEQLTIKVYQQKITPDAARADFERIWPWLRQQYPQWEARLRPFWQQTKAAGKQTQTDPFHLLLRFARPEAILGDWTAMQHLPAAREAINRALLDADF